MKKVSLAATVALALMGATTVANANGTVKSQPAATPAPAPATTAAAAAPAITPIGGGALNPASVELIARPGNHKNTNFELDVMFPVFQPSCGDRLLAIDIRGMRDVNRNTEGNFGLVYRHIVNNSFVLGGYGYFDYRRTRNKNNFTQAALGVDVLSNMFDARFNGYIAQNKKKALSGGDTTQFIGKGIATFNQFEVAQSGFDGEVGVRIPMPGMNNVETRVFVGGYRFSRGGTKTMSGPRGRLEVRILDLINPGSRLTLGLDVSNDKVRKTTVNGVIGLRIPMQFISGGRVPQGLQRRLADYVYRDVNINTGSVKQQGKNMQNPKTKQDWEVFHIDPNAPAGGDGSFEKKFNALDAATFTAIDKESIAVFASGNGTLTPPATLTLRDDQHFFGPGTDVNLMDGNTGTTRLVQSASTSQVIKITGNVNEVFDLGANNPSVEIGGFSHDAVGATSGLITGTFTAGTPKVIIRDIKATLDGAATNYILVNSNGNVQTDVSISNVGISGIAAAAPNFGVAVTSSGGAKVTANTSKLNIAGGAGAGGNGVKGLVALSSSAGAASSLTLNDNGSTYKDLNIGVQVQDISGAVANKSTVNFDIAGITSSGMSGAGSASVDIQRQDAGNVMSNVSMEGKVRSGKFSGGAVGDPDIKVSGGTGNAVANVNLLLKDNVHTDTIAGGSLAVYAEMQAAGVNTSLVNISMDNVSGKGAAGGAGIVIGTTAANTAGTAIRVNMTKVTMDAAYTNGITLLGGALGGNANQVVFDISGGGNKIEGTGANSSFSSGGTGPAAGAVGVITAANVAAAPIVTGAAPAGFNNQWPNGITY